MFRRQRITLLEVNNLQYNNKSIRKFICQRRTCMQNGFHYIESNRILSFSLLKYQREKCIRLLNFIEIHLHINLTRAFIIANFVLFDVHKHSPNAAN